ncbi:hypothetical protein L249_0774 [Ophiocordyceps polyrhachis-furcata BCC 54312]|uniref:Uncharacterized protein n=1 Tax=Ophiocordyceps polyrhachis-furcata BCC 54312 TaxID=1330021 RepID=A0A367LCL7_9HYPO|nr:hypothetical protein L249_0774 [Ophiocordyceps polyrhachis-furcata BCC 54312]
MAGQTSGSGRITATNQPKICFNFKRQGTCKFGAGCRYSHDTSLQQNGPPQEPAPRVRPPVDRPPPDGKFQQWKGILRHKPSTSRPPPTDLAHFFQLGRDLMDGDVGVSQEVVKLLATDPGLLFIKAVTEQNIDAASAFGIWTTQLEPLFRMISHPRLTDSAVLEQQVATVYNFLLGVGGSRMTKLFRNIGHLIQHWPTTTTDTSSMTAIELSLSVLSKILDCNTTNIVNESFSTFVSFFSECVTTSEEPAETFSRLQAMKYLDYMRLRLESGGEIQEWNLSSKANPIREQFVFRRDLPGHLSSQGPRHDNDNAEISNIKILPTWEEIMSVRDEYLPTADSSQWHIRGIRGRLDREFRLVREDTVGQVRDAVFLAFEKLHKTPTTRGSRNSKNSARTYIYEGATAIDVTFDRFSGLEMTVRCNQLPAVRHLGTKERKAWWMQSKRLQVGALVCALDPTGSVVFCIVSTSTLRTKEDRNVRRKDTVEQDEVPAECLTLSDDSDFLHLKLELVSAGQDEIRKVLTWYRSLGPRSSWCLVELPGVLLASFKYTLEALQRMYQKPDIPFHKVLEPSGSTSSGGSMNPPLYARAAGFTFTMNCLSHDGRELASSPDRPITPQQLASRSALDLTQSAALLNTLSREVSLIQGPPGTGKSYTGEKIIKVLLENKDRANLGPVLCVCYTNHALDQLLEHLLDGGIDKIIRIGSRSKSERLEQLNLTAVARTSNRTKAEKHGIYEVESSIHSIKRQMDEELRNLEVMESVSTLKQHLQATHPHHHDELFGKDEEDGWTRVEHSSHTQLLAKWLAGGSGDDGRRRNVGALQTSKLGRMNQLERQAIRTHWLHTIREQIIPAIQGHHDEFVDAAQARARARHDVDLRCLQDANVVGVTTTGLARSLNLLQKLRCKVMLCEEAGEVLEAHILTALLPSLEHAILVGDHLQLRPQIQNYELQSTNPRGREYSLDVSLFERLVQTPDDASDRRVPLSVLETQRRMHPDIAQLVRSTLYRNLKDSEGVKQRPQVFGIRDRLFWFHHEKLEAAAAKDDPTNTSHHNDFEVEMTVSLVSHLFRQGEYTHGDIAVLTPYLGQLHRLRRRMESMFEISVSDRDLEALEAVESDAPFAAATLRSLLNKSTLLKSVRVATVDNFQGEEAKVVVISLVRSNPQNKCGFLSTSNRINVLLSRARDGMYIIGNANTCQHVPMWAEVIATLKATSRFGTSLELQCPRHPNARLSVSQPDHFVQISPESGCNLLCNKRLHCGHTCSGRCHSDVLHNAVKCLEKCPRLKKGCDHPCPLPCGEACEEKCLATVEAGVTLPCGHHRSPAKCWEVQNPGSVWCKVKVTRTVAGCGHRVQEPCHKDVTTASYQCTAQCGSARGCGHECRSECFRCNTRKDGEIIAENHGICESKCGRNLTSCPHSCSQKCHGTSGCPPCQEACQASCSHSSCGKPCHEPCAPCAEATCPSRCPHSQCTMPCAAPCNWMPCSKRCPQRLSCGHRCPSLCGEPCPDERFCQQCGPEEIQSTCVDFIEMKDYREIDLDEEPCIFPQCGHFLTVTSMDGQMELSWYYELDEHGTPRSINRRSEPLVLGGKAIQVCGTCRGSLRSIARYGRIVRRALLDEATKKFISWSGSQHRSLAEKLGEQAELLSNKPVPTRCETSPGSTEGDRSCLAKPRLRQLRQLAGLVGHQRYNSIIGLWRTLYKYAATVRREEQPFQRVADLVRHANRLNQTRNEFVYDESVVQVKGSLSAETLLLECELVVYSDFAQLRKRTPWNQLEVKTDLSAQFKACEDVIQLASSTHHPKEEARAHMFAVRLCGLCLALGSYPQSMGTSSARPRSETESISQHTRDVGLHHVHQARALFDKFPSIAAAAALVESVDAAEATLKDGIYRPVTAEELQAVSAAMAVEFRGTGHWYRCANGHPFTVGECGMPMEEAACPECGAAVGGLGHRFVDGVRRDAEMDRLADRVTRLGV